MPLLGVQERSQGTMEQTCRQVGTMGRDWGGSQINGSSASAGEARVHSKGREWDGTRTAAQPWARRLE